MRVRLNGRQEAKAAGLTRYNGSMCRFGCGTERYTGTGHCVVCSRERVKNLYKRPEVRLRIKQYNKCYHADNKEYANERSRLYHEANKEIRNPKKSAYMRANRDKSRINRARRYAEDLNFRVTRTLRARISSAIKRRQKGGSAIHDLGCSVEFLLGYISGQFKEGMSWSNWGSTWQLDHKRALSSFDLTDRNQFLQAAHFTNLQPLLIADHRIKTVKDLRKRRVRLEVVTTAKRLIGAIQ